MTLETASNAKYSHWTGISTEVELAKALIVRYETDGGQSIKTYSYPSERILTVSFKSP